jgi:hypothetical protein
MIMSDIDFDLDQPTRVTPEPTRAIARTLSSSYPGTTAEIVSRDLAKARGGGHGTSACTLRTHCATPSIRARSARTPRACWR